MPRMACEERGWGRRGWRADWREHRHSSNRHQTMPPPTTGPRPLASVRAWPLPLDPGRAAAPVAPPATPPLRGAERRAAPRRGRGRTFFSLLTLMGAPASALAPFPAAAGASPFSTLTPIAACGGARHACARCGGQHSRPPPPRKRKRKRKRCTVPQARAHTNKPRRSRPKIKFARISLREAVRPDGRPRAASPRSREKTPGAAGAKTGTLRSPRGICARPQPYSPSPRAPPPPPARGADGTRRAARGAGASARGGAPQPARAARPEGGGGARGRMGRIASGAGEPYSAPAQAQAPSLRAFEAGAAPNGGAAGAPRRDNVRSAPRGGLARVICAREACRAVAW